MSRSKFPRVASRTCPKMPARPKLPKLFVGIYRDGELYHVIEQPDPREGVAAEWNKRHYGGEARPIDAEEAKAARKVLAGRKVANG